jgi:hypothetical protein
MQSHPIPQYSLDKTRNMKGQARWTVQATGWKLPNPGPHQPHKSPDMIQVCMRNKDIGNLMGNAGG